MGGAESPDRARAFADFNEAALAASNHVLLSATGIADERWGTAKRLLVALRQAPGLSGAADVALAELSALVPEIRDRFPRLPSASGKAGAIAEAIVQVLADVAAEAPVVVHVSEVGAADVESRSLLCSLLASEIPGVLFVVSDAAERIDTLRLGHRVSHARRIELAASRAATAIASKSITARARLRMRSGGALAAAALILITALAALLIPHARATSAPDQLAVLPFTLHASERYAYLREGLAEMLSTSLDGVQAVRTVDAHSVLRQATSVVGGLDPRTARALAQKVGAGLFVLGSITESGGVLRVQATLYRQLDERPLVRAMAEGRAENIFRLVDELAEQILSQLDESPSARFSRIAALTTDSLAALKAYLAGESQLRRFLVRDAFDAFQRAVKIDSTFALAWYGQATAASWMLSPEIAIEAADNAVRYAGRLSPRDRGIVELMRAFLVGRADEAERLARMVLAYYPDDVERRLQLAEVMFHFAWRRGRSFADAEPELRRVLRLEPSHAPALVHLAQIALHQGRRAEADTLTRRLMASYGEHPSAAWMGTLNAVATGDDRALDARLGDLYDAGDWWLTLGLWNLSNYSTDLAAADRAALLLADSGHTRTARAVGQLARAHIELARGRWQNARAELGQLATLHPAWYQEYSALLSAAPFLPITSQQYQVSVDQLRRWDAAAVTPPSRPVDPRPWATIHDQAHVELRHYLLGLLSLRLGDFGTAAREAGVLEARAGTDGPATLARGLAGGLRAQLLRLQDRPGDALAVLDATILEAPFEYAMVSSFWSQALERFLRAELLAETGQYDDALAVLRTFSETPVLDAIYRAPAELKAGEIAERRGDAANAVIHYRRFIQLWHDCDPELRPMVVEAQRRIERLQTSNSAAYAPPT
jgi:tetratricopeptide (TPR) repeat protein